MKNVFQKKSCVVACALAFAWWGTSIEAIAQCGPAAVSVTNYCPNQYGEFTVADPDPNTKYRWYANTPASIANDLAYGGFGADGKNFASPTTYPSGTGTKTFYYQKEVYNVLGGPSASTWGGQTHNNPYTNSEYSLTFTSPTTPFELKQVVIPLFTYTFDNTTTYRVQIEINGEFTQWYSFTRKDVTPVPGNSNVYLLTMPTWKTALGEGMLINPSAGPVTITAHSSAGGGASKIDFAWAAKANLNNSYTINPDITIDQTSNLVNMYNSGTYYSPLFLDWKIDLKCPLQPVSVSEQTDLTKCCTPVTTKPTLATVSGSTVRLEPFSDQVTASGTGTGLFYRWYYNGTLLQEGAGLSQVPISKIGKYQVRVVEKQADIARASCFNQSDVLIVKKRILVAKASKTEVCVGDEITLTAQGALSGVNWKPANLVQSPTAIVTTSAPATAGKVTYRVSALVPEGNLVENGDFEDGTNLQFDYSQTYKYADPKFIRDTMDWQDGALTPLKKLVFKDYGNNGNGVFTLVKHGLYQGGWHLAKGCADHTTGTGNFYMTDAASTASLNNAGISTNEEAYFWKQDVVVEPNTNYDFSAWFANASTDANNPMPVIQFYVNDKPILATNTLGKTLCQWQELKATWNSGPLSGTVTLKISETSHQGSGNDFMMDDVVFSSGNGTQTDEIEVTVKDCFFLDTLVTGTCQGDSVLIGAKTNGLFLGWTVKSGTATIKSPKDPITWVKPATPSVLEAKASYQIGNLVPNGDFEGGDAGFTSDYTCCLTSGGGHYSVGYSTDGVGFAVQGKRDHTSGKGLMYLSDGGSDPTQAVYRNTVDVELGKQYAFSAWLSNIHTNFVSANPDTANQGKTTYLAFYINGKYQNAIKLPLDTAWHQYYSLWTADLTGPVTIEIKDMETSPTGNDFALDDIVFAPLSPTQKTVTVKVPACVVCNQPTRAEITTPATDRLTQCEGSDLALAGRFANGGRAISSPAPNHHMYYAWYKKGTTPVYAAITPDPVGTGNVAVPAGNFAALALKDTGTYYLRVQDGNNPLSTCFAVDSVKLHLLQKPRGNWIDSTQTVCQGSPFRPLQTKKDSLVRGDVRTVDPYGWLVSTTGDLKANYRPVAAADGTSTGATFRPASSTAGTYFYKRIVYAAGTNGCRNDTSAAVQIVVDAPVTAGTVSVATPDVCRNQVLKAGNVTGTAASGGTGTYAYRWQISTTSASAGFTDIPAHQNTAADARNLDYTEPITGITTYFRRIDSSGTCKATSNVATLNGKDALQPGTIGKGDTVCRGTLPPKVPSLGEAAGGTGSTVSYQWQQSSDNTTWVDIPGSTSNELVFAQALATSQYYRRRAAKGTTPCDTSFTASVHFKVVDSATARIATPVEVISTAAKPTSAELTYRDTLFAATAETPLAEYTGAWSASLGNLMATGTDMTLNGIAFNQSSVVRWTVQDLYQACPAAIATLTITRKDFTTAKLEDDKNICITPAAGLTLKGLSKPQPLLEYATWSVKAGSKPATLLFPDPSDSSQALFTADGGAGLYTFYYAITNKVLGKTTKDSIVVRVDDATLAPAPYLDIPASTLNFPFDVASTPYLVCTSDLSLQGVASTQSSLSKTWWKVVSGTLDPITDSSALATISGLNGKAHLTLHYRNGVCPAVFKDVYLEKVADITPTIVGLVGGVHTLRVVGPSQPVQPIDSLCVGGTYTLNALRLPNDPPEKGKWTVVKGTSIGLNNPLDNPVQPLTVADTGITEITWEIANTQVACVPNSVTFRLVARKAPEIKALTGPSPLCEDEEGTYQVAYDSIGLAVNRQWRSTLDSAGNTVRAEVLSNSGGTRAAYRFSSTATSGEADKGFVVVKVANLCGADFASKEVQVDLRPKGLSVAFVTPLAQLCASDPGPAPFEVTVTPSPLANGTRLHWYWDGALVADAAAPVLRHDLLQSAYASKSGNIPLQVKLANACGEALATDKAWSPEHLVTIQQSKPLKVQLTAAGDNKVCVPTGGIKDFQALPDPGGNLLIDPVYQFFVDGQGPFGTGALPAYTASLLSDSSIVKVVLTDAKGCFDGARQAQDSLVIEGFHYPDSTLYPTTPTTMCEQDPQGPVILTFKRTTTKLGSFLDNGAVYWVKDGDTVARGTDPLVLTRPDQRGAYTLVVGRNVCAGQSKSKTAVPVMIYERPKPVFGPSPMLIYYQPGVTAKIPLWNPGTRDKLLDIEWTPATWLNSPDSLAPIVQPTRDERTIEYQVLLYTGEQGVTCLGTGTFQVINSLPLEIPNAFSPNGDGLNDVWVIEGLGKYPNTRVKVYNRWGNSMYIDSYGYKVSWDGTHNGYPLPAGTYYYLVELRGSPDDTDHDVTGSITLVR